MAKQISEQQAAFLEKRLSELKSQRDGFKAKNEQVPQFILNYISDIESKLSPNKFKAKKMEYNGHVFDSVLEARFCEFLDKMQVPYEKQYTIELQPSFDLNGERYKPINIRVDFVVHGYFIIDTKGLQTDDWKNKWKMLKFQNGNKYFYMTITAQKEFEAFRQKLDNYIKGEKIFFT